MLYEVLVLKIETYQEKIKQGDFWLSFSQLQVPETKWR